MLLFTARRPYTISSMPDDFELLHFATAKLLAFLCVGLHTVTAQPATNSSVVFANVTIVDCTGAPARINQMVIVKGNRITDLGRQGSLEIPPGATIVESSGKYLMPGLWDMHVHLLWEHIGQFLPLCIANGVTGIRDLHTKLTPE